jgi:hypothetical protein
MAANTQEIPKEQWLSTFNRLSRLYQGWGLTIELLAGELGDQPLAKGEQVPLQGLSVEAKGGSAAGDILIEVGDANIPYEVHRIERPRVVRVAETQPGEETDIEVESEDGAVQIIRIRRRADLPPPSQAATDAGTTPHGPR